ncbi:hypothetical protein PDK03_06750 [Bacillus cereus group sp. TH204-1LC]|uniref:hypothetical protein n=1 Tax=Bacillus cereus group sp. TH204-1LC TaxID=3018054 RepID=UPI0022DEE752|nr:hypothetical protein [Bacillus cereus group sp. TH204-1LC]MDA1616293.1 hypothetical protein [Bacillus cereus group sp. TH204-1LC]
MENIKFYARVKNKWARRRSGLKNPALSELYDATNKLDEKYGVKHWAFPADINPEDYPELLVMEEVVTSHVNHYSNDFYLHDLHAYLTGDKKALWLLRSSGTHYIPLEDKYNPMYFDLYKSYIVGNKYFYLIDNGKIQKITAEKANTIIQEKLFVAA